MTRSGLPPADVLAINAVLVASRQAADAICDRWSLAIVLSALQGARRFNDLARSTGMATRLLTDRLRTLEASGILLRIPYSIRPLRHEYRLTNMGEQLQDVILQMARWETGQGNAPSLRHLSCGSPLVPRLTCRSCGDEVSARDIDLKTSPGQLRRMPDKKTSHRRTTLEVDSQSPGLNAYRTSLAIFGDKWGIEILLCAFFRIRRFGDFRALTGIAANILSDRLERLVAAGVLAKQGDTPQGGYRLTAAGLDLYGIIVEIQAWADAWLPDRYHSPVKLIHRGCGQEFRPRTVCRECGTAPGPGSLGFPAAG